MSESSQLKQLSADSANKLQIPQLEQLSAEFKTSEHKSRVQGGKTLTYISIDATINRLNAVLGSNWSTQAETKVAAMEGGYLAITELTLHATIDGARKAAYGVGAMVNRDPDMAAKTALAEAIKKAGHQLGIGLYLWDEEARDRIQKKSALAGAGPEKLKMEVMRIAKERLEKEKPTAKEVAALFKVTAAALAEDETIRTILEGEGRL